MSLPVLEIMVHREWVFFGCRADGFLAISGGSSCRSNILDGAVCLDEYDRDRNRRRMAVEFRLAFGIRDGEVTKTSEIKRKNDFA